MSTVHDAAIVVGSVVAVDLDHLGHGCSPVVYHAIVRSVEMRRVHDRVRYYARIDYAAGTRDDRVPFGQLRLVDDPTELAEAIERLTRAGLLPDGRS